MYVIKQYRMGALALLLSFTAIAPAHSGDPAAAKFDSANDPRSNAALNLEHAKRFKASNSSQVPTFGSQLGPIAPDGVNNPALDATAQDTQSETTVVRVSGPNLVAAFNDSGSFIGGSSHFTGFAYSSDGGKTWTDGGTLPASAEGDAGDPVLAVNKTTGHVYLATLGFNTGENLQVFKSTDMGHTWGAPVNGTPGYAGSGAFQDKEWMEVDNFAGPGNGNIYLCWTRFNPNGDIMFTRSIDGGASFGPSGGTLLSTGGQGCYVVVSPNHQVNVFYYRGTGSGGQGGDNKLWLRRSNDGGVTFGAEVQVADLNTTTTNGNLALAGGLRSNSFPHAAVSPRASKPYLYVVYNDDPNIADPSDNGAIYMVYSTDGGTTWSVPKAIDNSSGDQFFPTIGFAEKGARPLIGYYSRSLDPSNSWFHRRSRLGVVNADGSLSLHPSFQLSPNTPVVIGQDPVINATYMGDYDQIAPGDAQVYTTWADHRNGNSFHAHQPDVRSAVIQVNPVLVNLSLLTSATPSTISPGGTTTVKAKVSSASGDSKDVFVNLRSAPGLTIESASVPSGTCNVDGIFADCHLGKVAAGGSRTISAVVRTTECSGVHRIYGTVSTSSRDPVQNDNKSSAALTVSGSCTTTNYSTGNLAVPLPDLTTVDTPLNVPDSGPLLKVIPSFRLNHTWDADLRIYLVSPTGTIVELSTDNGGSGDNYGTGANDCTGTPTVFDDSAATPITAGVPPFAGTFKPEGTLATFAGEESSGTWILRITDVFGADPGTLGCFNMTLTK
ncbi:MAG: proprotein convertase P-domain-containing protein [Alphaproteobacteria bacterium]|nr:proprotein convertase P-domain-containing protein [Alphaproteobacteria bacterium]